MFVRITSEYSPILLQFMIFRTSLKSFLEGQAKGVTMKNLNSSILENMEVINPPTYLQKEFANIVEKVEGIKSRYQASLTDLENIYGALSQKAFKGELDLSRVPLPPDDTEATAAENPETNEPPQTTNTFDLPAPSELSTLNSAEGRHALLDHWLTVWLERRNGTPFSTQPFIDAAQQRLWELAEDDALELGAADYDAVRAWILASLEQRQNHRSQRLPQLTRRI
jgi:type I restriction enzyme S subunit